MYYTVFETELCKMTIVGDENGITHLHLTCEESPESFTIERDWEKNKSFFTEEIRQINEYLEGQRKTFDVIVNPQGTAFQHMVWEALMDIPYGKTVDYADIAQRVNNPGAYRAVGAANAKNPIPIIIPCHRVIGSDGSLTGYAYGVNMKEKLINLERGII